jgi:predicted nucleotidyltransferase component of viral defense system
VIRKQDILDRAAEWQLRPEVVEKDYVLGWLLAALSTLPMKETWIFKGGTSIKKCYFETYRFSEDLDFSLLPGAAYSADELLAALQTLAGAVYDLSGIECSSDAIILKERQNLQGQPTFEGRLAYRGPLAYPGSPKIRFDLTRHEPVLDLPADRTILHPYPDALPTEAAVRAYSFNEVVAEKTRALFERCRPRDLYDVIHLLENAPDHVDLPHVRKLFGDKCRSKALVPPGAQVLTAAIRSSVELRSEWSNMLAHQLPALPDLDPLLAKIDGLLTWLDVEGPNTLPEEALPPAPIAGRDLPFVGRGLQYRGARGPIETIRFAGSNRLLLEFDYHGKHRVVEPYSVRQAASTGNVLLYALELASNQIKAFNIAEMQSTRSTGRVFAPRYRVEFSESGPIRALPVATHTASRLNTRGPEYVYECLTCHKRFVHSKAGGALRKHKSPDGWGDCPGRRGYLVETR